MTFVFLVVGIYMMFIIAILRYHAAVHALKHATSQQKLRTMWFRLYFLFDCRLRSRDPWMLYDERFYGPNYVLFFHYVPTFLMAVLYYNVYQTLVQHNKYLQSLGLVAQSNSSSKILQYIWDRRTFPVNLCTVLCYVAWNFPMSVHASCIENSWKRYVSS